MQGERRANKTQRNDDFCSPGARPWEEKNVAAFIVWQAIIGGAASEYQWSTGCLIKNLQVDKDPLHIIPQTLRLHSHHTPS